MSEMCRLGLEGKAEEARAIQQKMMPLHTHLFIEANPIPVKWAMYEMGLMDKGIRLPLTVLSQESQPVVKQAMVDSGILK